ncbi:MAG: ATP-binding protein, partial [Chloroflexota bacterium]
RLQQILANLIGNALKFTAQGEVTLRIYCPDAGHWVMEISDTGQGIPMQAQPLIFDPFWQVDGSITRRQKGTGLGLAIVKQLVELMDGQISVDSQEDQGSTFAVTLPFIRTEVRNV